jgi:hypothetical protein
MSNRSGILTGILLGGLVAGTIDIGAASLINWVSPVDIAHFIAGGFLGRVASFAGGTSTAVLGLVLQWIMALIIAVIFAGIALVVPIVRRHWLIGGLVYGLPVFVVMNFVVVPLSAIHRFPHFTAPRFIENLVAMLLFGVIVAWFAREKNTTTT